MHWTQKYINRKWTPAYNCYTLYQDMVLEQTGVKLPDQRLKNHASPSEVHRRICEYRSEWTRIEKPTHLCAVVFGRRNLFYHIGCYLEDEGGLIVHMLMNSFSAIQTEAEIMNSQPFTQIEYYTYGNNCKSD